MGQVEKWKTPYLISPLRGGRNRGGIKSMGKDNALQLHVALPAKNHSQINKSDKP